MELERVAIVLRPRTAWEGVDLGVAIWQRWSRQILLAWAFTVVPMCATVLVATRGDGFFLPILITWWLSPLFERVGVHVMSRAVFGAPPTLLATLRALPGVWGRRTVLAITLHRLHPAHAVIQPIVQLEGLPLSKLWKREGIIAHRTTGTAWLASVLCFLFHFALAFGALVALVFLVPAEFRPDFQPLWEGDFDAFDPGWLTTAFQVLWLAGYCAAGPLNAAVGFGLYLNRRTHLEGWDVEVAFRRLAQRVQRRGKTPLQRAGALLALICAASVLFASTARAQQAEATSDEVAQALERVLSADEFQTERKVESWTFDWDPDAPGAPSWLADLLRLLGPLIEVALWALALAALVFVVVAVARRFGWLELQPREREAQPESPTHLFGLDLRPQTLPEDIPGTAWQMWLRGETAAALGLLYRGAIARLIARDGLALERSDTESDCLRRARTLASAERAAYFGAVTQAWQVCAYSSRRPASETVERLCRDWTERFEPRVP